MLKIWDFACDQGHITERLTDDDERVILCPHCDKLNSAQRLLGGHGMLYFEEGRARQQDSLGDKPITSYAQQKREMRQRGLVETGDNVPPSVAKSPKSIGLKRHMEKDNKGRWI
jgi:hypothetical protein